MRFLGLALSDQVPDAKMVWVFRACLTQAGAIQKLFDRFNATLRNAGYLPMFGQSLDATCVTAPKQRNTSTPKADPKEGRIPQDGLDTEVYQSDVSGGRDDPAIPSFGYKSHISIDRNFILIRKWKTTNTAVSDGTRLREVRSIKSIQSQTSGRIRRIARKPMRTSWADGPSSRRLTGKSHISNPYSAISSGPI